MKEYVNVRFEEGGSAYRVAFHVGTRRPMIVARQRGDRDAERYLHIHAPRGQRLVGIARILWACGCGW